MKSPQSFSDRLGPADPEEAEAEVFLCEFVKRHIPIAVDSELVVGPASIILSVPGSDESKILLEDMVPLVHLI